MSETLDNTLSAYKGPEFQQRLMWQLLVEPEFAEKIIPVLAIEYFDDPYLKRLFIIILEYVKRYGKVPNLQNQSIHHAVNEFKTPNNSMEEESLFAVIKRIELWNERIINKQMHYDGDVVQKSTNEFVKQQEYRKLAESILDSVKKGNIRSKYEIAAIEEKFQKISHIGDDEDDCEEVIDGIDKALRKEFRQTIPTGIEVIDSLTGGGLGKGEIGVILTPSGVGKALPISANLLTPNGWIKNGNVRIGDLVIGSDGKSQKVLGVYPQGMRDIYKIEFNDETSIFCDEEHIWSVNSLNQRTANTTKRVNGKIIHIKTPDYSYKQKTTRELIKNYIINSGKRKKLNYRIPIVKPVQHNVVENAIHPYVLGVMLGDGYMRGCEYTTTDLEIIDNVKKYYNGNITISLDKRKKNNIYRVRLCKSSKLFKNCDLFDKLSDTKFIPDSYLYNSVENRIFLLNGLLDTDGFASKEGRIQYTTTSKKLAIDVRNLVLSLGGFCKIREKTPKYKYNGEFRIGKLSYILTISFTNNEIRPFLLERKQSRVIYRDKYKYNKYISSIKYSHQELAQCIYVENDDHLYVADDYILTHNTTALTIIADTAYQDEKNVAQIIFEDTKDQIKRKHYTIWADSALSKLNEDGENERVCKIVHEKAKQLEGRGRLVIKKFSQENTTMMDVKNWMIGYQKKFGFKFDILVLDYLDCLESHKKSADRNEAELAIIKAFEALASDFDIPAWTAIQSNRSGFGAEFIDAQQSGGSIKRIQKAHFFMSVAKTQEQKEAQLANISILKARFAQDGQKFEDCVFNNDTMKIIINDPRFKYSKSYKGLKHYDNADSIESAVNKIHAAVSQSTTMHDEETLISKVNSDSINLPETIKDVSPTDINRMLQDNIVKFENFTSQQKNELEMPRIIEEVDDGSFELENSEIEEVYSELTTIDNLNDTIKSGNDLLVLSAETETEKTNIINVKLEDFSDKVDMSETVNIKSEIEKNDSIPVHKILIEGKKSSNDLESLLIYDPDDVPDENRSVFDLLKKTRENQRVIKND